MTEKTAAPEQDEEHVLTREQCNALQTIGIPMDEIQTIFQLRAIKTAGYGRLEAVIQDGIVKFLKPEICVMNPSKLPLPYPVGA